MNKVAREESRQRLDKWDGEQDEPIFQSQPNQAASDSILHKKMKPDGSDLS